MNVDTLAAAVRLAAHWSKLGAFPLRMHAFNLKHVKTQVPRHCLNYSSLCIRIQINIIEKMQQLMLF